MKAQIRVGSRVRLFREKNHSTQGINRQVDTYSHARIVKYSRSSISLLTVVKN